MSTSSQKKWRWCREKECSKTGEDIQQCLVLMDVGCVWRDRRGARKEE